MLIGLPGVESASRQDPAVILSPASRRGLLLTDSHGSCKILTFAMATRVLFRTLPQLPFAKSAHVANRHSHDRDQVKMYLGDYVSSNFAGIDFFLARVGRSHPSAALPCMLVCLINARLVTASGQLLSCASRLSCRYRLPRESRQPFQFSRLFILINTGIDKSSGICPGENVHSIILALFDAVDLLDLSSIEFY